MKSLLLAVAVHGNRSGSYESGGSSSSSSSSATHSIRNTIHDINSKFPVRRSQPRGRDSPNDGKFNVRNLVGREDLDQADLESIEREQFRSLNSGVLPSLDPKKQVAAFAASLLSSKESIDAERNGISVDSKGKATIYDERGGIEPIDSLSSNKGDGNSSNGDRKPRSISLNSSLKKIVSKLEYVNKNVYHNESVRKLAVQPTVGDWSWLSGTRSRICGPGTSTVAVGECGTEGYSTYQSQGTQFILQASTDKYYYDQIDIWLSTLNTFGGAGSMKFIDGAASARSLCQNGMGYDKSMSFVDTSSTTSYGTVAKPFMMGLRDDLSNAGISTWKHTADQPFAFMHGGVYKLCWSPDGDWSTGRSNNVQSYWLDNIMVVGISSSCTTDGCLKQERWECWYPGLGEQPVDCTISFVTGSKRMGWDITTYSGAASYMMTTKEFLGEVYNAADGTVTTAATQVACETAPADAAVYAEGSANWKKEVTQSKQAHLGAIKYDKTGGFTLRLCYCPNRSHDYSQQWACSEAYLQNFNQAFGVMYFWQLNICDKGTATGNSGADCMNSPYLRALPQTKVVIQIACPPSGGCLANNNNRISFVDPAPANDRNFWDSQSGCSLAGSTQSAKAVWPSSGQLEGGGTRLDYKVWMAKIPKLNLSTGEKIDVCYCNDGCTTGSNWFRIGHVIGANFNLASTGTLTSGSVPLVQHAGKAGTISFIGGYTTPVAVCEAGVGTTNCPNTADQNKDVLWGDSQKYSDYGMVKVISYNQDEIVPNGQQGMATVEKAYGHDKTRSKNFISDLETSCNSQAYSADLITGPSDLNKAQEWHAKVDAGGDRDAAHTHMTFSGATNDKQITVKKAGVVVICYCGIIDEIASPWSCSSYKYASLLMIAGPLGTQVWDLPIQLVSKIVVQGHGFRGGDLLRIIPATSTCTDNNNNPVPDTSYKAGCPSVDGYGNNPTSNGADCKVANANTYLELSTLNKASWKTEKSLESLETAYSTSTYTVFKFDQIVQGTELHEGDTILFDKTDIKFGDQEINTWGNNIKKLEAADQLTNDWGFLDTRDPNQGTYRSNPLGWKITFFDNAQIAKADKGKYISVPFDYANTFGTTGKYPWTVSFRAQGDTYGRWYRTNKADTKVELKGVNTANDLKVCWGKMVGGVPQFYKQAGTLNFFHPSNMTSSKVSLTATEEGAIAPAIITFETSDAATDYATYSNVPGKGMKLVIRFLNTKKLAAFQNSPLETHTSAISALSGSPVESDMSQANCGMLFVELWSNDREGFPFPKGCYYSSSYQDDGSTEQWREFVMVFHQGNGLKHRCTDHLGAKISCQYQLLMYLSAKGSAGLQEHGNYVDIYTKCDGCKPNGMDVVFEVGHTQLSTVGNGGSQMGANGNTPEIDSFTVMHAGSNYLDLGINNQFDIRMRAKSGTQMIYAKCKIFLFMMPLLEWNVPTDSPLKVTCVDHQLGQEQKYCGNKNASPPELRPDLTSFTAVRSVANMSPARNNLLVVTLPKTMSDPVTADVQHILQFTGLTYPETGHFNKRWGVQLTDPDGNFPNWSWTAGFFSKEPDPKTTTGRIIINGQTGYGPKPFMGDVDNLVYVRFQLGVTLWNNGQPASGTLTIRLPNQASKAYTCALYDGEEGLGGVPRTLPPFQKSNKQIRDENNDGYIDNNWARLGTQPVEGFWQDAGLECVYTLGKFNAIHAGQVFYSAFRVTNPDAPMKKSETANEWRIKLSSKGVYADQPIDMPSTGGYTFLASESEVNEAGKDKLWYKNLGVLNEVSSPVLQPTNFIVSTPTVPQESWFYVFFQTQSEIGRPAIIKLDAPCGYDFKDQCKAEALPDYYYDFLNVGISHTTNLTQIQSCTGYNLVEFCGSSTSKYNRAKILVRDNLRAFETYGFQVHILHASEFHKQHQNDWKLWVADSQDYVVDGTRDTLFFQLNNLGSGALGWGEHIDKAFGLYATDFGEMQLTVSSTQLMPTSMTTNPSYGWISLDGLMITGTNSATATTFRMTAPPGYEFLQEPYWTSGSTYVAYPHKAPNRQNFKCDNPTVKVGIVNQIRFDNCQFMSQVLYGFSVQALVPDFSPTNAMNVFFLEMGFKGTDLAGTGTSSRIAAKMIPAQRVTALRNTLVDYSSNRAGDDNTMTIEFYLVTPLLDQDDGIVIAGQEGNADYRFTCYTEKQIPGTGGMTYEKFPLTYGCQFANQRYTLYNNGLAWKAGYYRFEVSVINPQLPVDDRGSWLFGTYKNSHNGGYPQNKLDKSVYALGFPNRDLMPLGAKIVKFSSTTREATVRSATKRDDRPGYPPAKPQKNNLIFQFSLKNKPTEVGKLLLRGPKGYLFEDSCTQKVITSENMVFGANSAASWDPQFTKWADQYQPTHCEARGNRANITIPIGLNAGSTYVFRIEIASNPSETPIPNLWTIEYNKESSLPFEGFTLHTATGVKLTPTSKARRSTGGEQFPNPLEFVFKPFQTIPAWDPNVDTLNSGGMIRLQAPTGYIFVTSSRRALGDDSGISASGSGSKYVQPHQPGVGLMSWEDYEAMEKKRKTELHRMRREKPSENLPALPEDAEVRSLLGSPCNVNLQTVDGQIRFVMGDEIICEVTGDKQSGMFLSAKIKSTVKSVTNTKTWQMTVYVYNREQTGYQDVGYFQLESFKSSDGASQSKLDMVQIPAFKTTQLLNEFTVLNPDSQFMGDEAVRNVQVSMRFPDSLRDSDEIWLIGPVGFSLVAPQATTAQCNNFKYDGGYSPLPQTVQRICGSPPFFQINNVVRGGLQMIMNGLGSSQISLQDTALRFSIDTVNPAMVTSEVGNYWITKHVRNLGQVDGVTQYEVQSEDAHSSWAVKPQLQNVIIQISKGKAMAAESYTDLEFSFLPVNRASTIKIEAMQPADFRFDDSIVEGFTRDGATGNNVLVINDVDIQANVNIMIKVTNVKLGVQGGATVWSMATFDRALVGGQPSNPSDLKDEKINQLGFIMPGKLSIISGSFKLESDYQQSPSTYPMESTFPPRVGETSRAIMKFKVTQTVYAKAILRIKCDATNAYLLDDSNLALSGAGSISVLATADKASGALNVELKPQQTTDTVVLMAGSEYTLRFRVTPQIGANSWILTTFNSLLDSTTVGVLPSNTNDGVSPALSPVHQLGFTVKLPNDRSPPSAEIEITVEVIPNGAQIRSLTIIGPDGFDFPQSCGDMCTRGETAVGVEGRISIKIERDGGEPLTPAILKSLNLKTITPSVTPVAMKWFVLSRTGAGNGATITGWASFSGFQIKQMSLAKLWYPARRGLADARFAFSFRMSATNGKRIEVNAPPKYQLFCSSFASTGLPALDQLSLPGENPTCQDYPLTLTLTEPMSDKEYAFVIGGNVPADGKDDGVTNYFHLVIKDEQGRVIDAAYELAARHPLQEIPARDATLKWVGVPQRQRTTDVTVGITFDAPTSNIVALLITFPPGLKHDIVKSTDVKNLNKGFPVAAASSWVDMGNDAYIRIFVDNSKVVVIPADRYEFEFPILYPVSMHAENIWYVSLCTTRECRDIDNDPSDIIPIIFPVAGFYEGDVAPGSGQAAHSPRKYYGDALTIFIITFFVPVVLFSGIFM